MGRTRRLIAACALALLCAPGTWLRSEVVMTVPRDITVTQVQGAGSAAVPGWTVAGVWHYDSAGGRFGGFSAMLALGPGMLRAFTDRSFRITLTEPDQSGPRPYMNRQFVEPGWDFDLVDSESATRDPGNGNYWIGYEQTHAIQRNTIASSPDGVRDLRKLVDWPDNSGIEAMVRLADGRFVILPEGRREGLIFPEDPVDGGTPARFAVRSPAEGYVATDAAQLPDGRLMVLMRDVISPRPGAWPPFSCLLAIGLPPASGEIFAPQVALRLDGVIPRENYEGLALRPRDDGRIDVWVISDDNFSIFQRTLLAKLVFDPGG
ncbi:esterase-like activity of phytase family protein [Erythrobacter dokdonensis]|uniref:Phytase-like domain-containing protein n=1 Tax=Erythrobacter dokdonensis DSW-74 TaxID=1300349 RepID=A0A1A7BGH7_9SPHN|nr:esterase-like activity of phytase family protein [Erythrobacter dokdonensis]OBV10831.1 Phytase-like domain-containing protein [Erythrobacter dokdonensis DSW-74]